VTPRDISIAVHPATPEWPGDTPFSCGWTWRIAEGASVNLSALTMSPHLGTHADAPLHVADGWDASDELPLEPFIGPAVVCSVPPGTTAIQLHDLPTLLPSAPVERLLLRTGRSIADGSFPDAWPALTTAAVRALLRRGLRLLGVDAPSVDDRDSRTLDVHRALFAGGAYNLENLDLRGVDDGVYELTALPIKLRGLDAAPVRAVLRRG
jgi:arylformamidase